MKRKIVLKLPALSRFASAGPWPRRSGAGTMADRRTRRRRTRTDQNRRAIRDSQS